MDDELAQRHLDLVLAGLRAGESGPPAPLGGPALDIAAIGRLSPRHGREANERGER